jgi:TPR repeat protein
MFYEGKKGVQKDLTKAAEWFRKAAIQGSEYSQFRLGEIYYHGRGVPRDYTEAIKWYTKAAEQKHDVVYARDAKFKLSFMFHDGIGVATDYVTAYMWLIIIQIETRAALVDDKGVDYLNKITSKMTAAQVAEARRRAQQWIECHAS